MPRVQYKCSFPESSGIPDVEYDDFFFDELGSTKYLGKALAPEEVFRDAVNGSRLLGISEAKRTQFAR